MMNLHNYPWWDVLGYYKTDLVFLSDHFLQPFFTIAGMGTAIVAGIAISLAFRLWSRILRHL